MILGTILFILIAMAWLFGVGIFLGLFVAPFMIASEEGNGKVEFILAAIICWPLLIGLLIFIF